jgi:hypothetical protein
MYCDNAMKVVDELKVNMSLKGGLPQGEDTSVGALNYTCSSNVLIVNDTLAKL